MNLDRDTEGQGAEATTQAQSYRRSPATEGYRSPSSVGLAISVMFVPAILLAAAAAGAALATIDVVGAVLEAPTAGNLRAFTNANVRVDLLGALSFVTLLPVVVLFVIWTRRVYRNLPSLEHEDLRFRPGWAVWGWFVPIMNWFRPKQIMNEVWIASEPTGGGDMRVRVPALVHFWWATYVLWALGNNVFASLDGSIEPSTARAQITAQNVLIAATMVLTVVGGLLAMWVVSRVGARQDRRAGLLGVASSGSNRTARRWPFVAIGGAAAAIFTGALVVSEVDLPDRVIPAGLSAVGSPTTPVPGAGVCVETDPSNFTGPVERPLQPIPCEAPHEFEIAATLHLPNGPWPGDQEMAEVARNECVPRLEAYVGVPVVEAGLWARQVRPSEESWTLGDRTVHCLIRTPRPVTYSVQGRGADAVVSDEGWVLPDRLEEGDCVSADSRLDDNFVKRVACTEPHFLEVSLVIELGAFPNGEFVGEETAQEFADYICRSAFEEWVGTPAVNSTLTYDYVRPTEDTWKLGAESVICFVAATEVMTESSQQSGPQLT